MQMHATLGIFDSTWVQGGESIFPRFCDRGRIAKFDVWKKNRGKLRNFISFGIARALFDTFCIIKMTFWDSWSSKILCPLQRRSKCTQCKNNVFARSFEWNKLKYCVAEKSRNLLKKNRRKIDCLVQRRCERAERSAISPVRSCACHAQQRVEKQDTLVMWPVRVPQPVRAHPETLFSHAGNDRVEFPNLARNWFGCELPALESTMLVRSAASDRATQIEHRK